ncbi:hypothetical protein V6N13_011498 [Hibiscus sabdariffa]
MGSFLWIRPALTINQNQPNPILDTQHKLGFNVPFLSFSSLLSPALGGWAPGFAHFCLTPEGMGGTRKATINGGRIVGRRIPMRGQVKIAIVLGLAHSIASVFSRTRSTSPCPCGSFSTSTRVQNTCRF